jgi:hypothetical protein
MKSRSSDLIFLCGSKYYLSDKRYAGDNNRLIILESLIDGIVWHLDVGSSSWS